MAPSPNEDGPADRITLVMTNLGKLGGIVLGVHEGFRAHADARVIAFAALLVAGIQGVERVLRGLFGNNGKG
jgi:hypothetical protein